MKKVVFILLGVFSLVLVFLLIYKNYKEEELNIIFKISIFPSSTSEESYYFVLYSNAVMESYKGTRREDDISRDNFFMKVDDKHVQVLSPLEFDNLQSLISEFTGIENPDSLFLLDGWIVKLFYDNKLYQSIYGEKDAINNLVAEIIKYSVIDVDVHSWS